MTTALQFAVRWLFWLSGGKGRAEDWNCKNCIEAKKDKARDCGYPPRAKCPEHGWFEYTELEEIEGGYKCPHCDAKIRWGFTLPLGKNFVVYSCPIQQLDHYALFLVRLVLWSEEIHVLPDHGGLYDQSNFYFEIRNIVVAEKSVIMEEQREDEERKSKLAQQRKDGPSVRGRRK